VIFRRAPLLR